MLQGMSTVILMKTLTLLVLSFACASPSRAGALTTLIGTGMPGFSDTQVNNPYGMTIGPDGALYFCDLDNQRVRRMGALRGWRLPWGLRWLP